MYKNIVFDLGGVVVNYAPKDYLMERFFHEKTEKNIYDAVFGSEEWKLLDLGQITWGEAYQIFMQRGIAKNIETEMQALLDEWLHMLSDRKATITLMRLLKKKGFNLYYLSNISKYAFNYISNRKYWALFSGGVASFDVKLIKPNIEIYKLLLNKYSLVPQETIFTDDSRDNATKAFEVGVTGISFENVKSLCKMLVTYGIDI